MKDEKTTRDEKPHDGGKPAPSAPHASQRSDKKPRDRIRNLKGHVPGPGRPKGTPNRFNQGIITDFVHNYRADLAADWNQHGAEFIERCRATLPQVYATMQRMRLEDELLRAPEAAGPMKVSWQVNTGVLREGDDLVLRDRIRQLEEQLGIREGEPLPPKQITYDPGPLPSRLSDTIISAFVSMVRECVPKADQRDPHEVLAEVIGIAEKALRAHYSEKPD